ncbi:MAG: hypothetical protein WAR79_10740 [Melioribacteraceae bacterium]
MVAIFVLIIFLSVLVVDIVVLNLQGKYHPAFEPLFNPLDMLIFDKSNYLIPSDMQFSKGHTWLRKNEDGTFDIGIDSFGTTVLGTMPILNYPVEGTEIKCGEMLLEAGRGDDKIKFLSPISGIVKVVNRNLIESKISDAYSTWNVKLISENFSENEKMLLSGSKASTWMKKEFKKLKKFIDIHSVEIETAGATMYDGGSLSEDAVSSIVFNNAEDFEMKFLSYKSEI